MYQIRVNYGWYTKTIRAGSTLLLARQTLDDMGAVFRAMAYPPKTIELVRGCAAPLSHMGRHDERCNVVVETVTDL